jgi:phage terminase large subunit-like protein
VSAVDGYAQDVVAGRRLAGKYHRLACARHLRDRARQPTRAFPYYFDPTRAARFFRFAEALTHYKGKWAGEPIRLQRHQQFRLGSVFGWLHRETGLRRFRTSYTEIPRKNGKSLEAALVALYVSFFDGEAGAEGYCVATKREQAKLVYNDAKRLVRHSGLRYRIEGGFAKQGALVREATDSKLEALGADSDSTDGLNPNLVVFDEFHAQKVRDMIDVMETALGARQQPLMYQITTAGQDLRTPCGDQHHYACQILDQVLRDDTFFAFIAHADKDDPPFEERTWRKANPNYGVSVNPAEMKALARKAQHMPPAAAAFKQKRLNLWVLAGETWLSIEGWQAGQSQWDAAALAGKACWIGIDMSSKLDLTAVVCLFPPDDDCPRWRVLARCLTPEDTLDDRAHRDRAPYRGWVERGWLETNPGKRIDQNVVLDWVNDANARYQVLAIGVDPWNAGNLVQTLNDGGFLAVEVPQTFNQMSQPSKEFEADVLEGLVDSGGNELLQWCVSNAVAQMDGKENIYPTKRKSRGRIDPVVATVIARKLAGLDLDNAADDPELVVA